MTEKLTRFVITHINKDGARTLAEPMQGRFTYATREEAQTRLDRLAPSFKAVLSFHDLEVREVEVYPGHFDPKTCWFN